MSGQYNLKSPAVKRLMKEAQELRESTEQYFAQPLDDNLFEWHFTIRGPIDSEFDGGIYHGRITLPPEYPMKPPSIMLLTPNGRFETFKKICLSISGHHPESWQPSWSIRTALLAIIGFMPTHGNGAIGSLDYTPEERKVLAKRSIEWKCPECGSTKAILKPVTEASKKTTEEAKELATQINFQGEKEKKEAKKESPGAVAAAADTVAGAGSSAPEASSTAGSATESTTAPTRTSPLTPGFSPFVQNMFPSNFPGGIPNAAMPPRMMAPGGPMGPFTRPFWPGMPGNSATSGMPAGSTAPPRPLGMMYPWPPMFNPMMMNEQMAAMMNQHMPARFTTSTPAATPVAVTSTTTVMPPTQTTASSSSSSSSSTRTQASSSSSTQQSAASSSAASPATTSSTESATTTPTSNATTSSTPIVAGAAAATTTGLRQRVVVRASPQVVVAAYGTAELQTAQRGENPAVLLVMALLGLLIIALILRRLYNVVNAGAFDNDF